MKNIQFTLKIKKKIIYSERIVELGEGIIKYFKKKNPKEIRFQANLSDLVFYEKYKDKLSKYKIILNSKSNQFPLIKIRPPTNNDINPLLNFKTQLENFILAEKNSKNKKEEIIMRIVKAEKSNVVNKNNLEENLKDINSDRKNSLKFNANNNNLSSFAQSLARKSILFSNKLNTVNTSELYLNNINNFSQFKILDENNLNRFDHILKLNFQFFKNKNNVEIKSNDNNLLKRKLFNLFKNKNKNEEFNENLNFDNIYKSHLNLNSALNISFLILLISLIIYNLLEQNFLNVFIVTIIYFYLNYKIFGNFKFNLIFDITQNKNDIHNNFYVKSETNINTNIFSITNYLTDVNYHKNIENFELEYFYNFSDNLLILIECKNGEIVNMFHLKSNDQLTKTKITFINLINSENNKNIKPTINKLNHFVNFVEFNSKNQIYFNNENLDNLDGIEDYKKIEKIIENCEEGSDYREGRLFTANTLNLNIDENELRMSTIPRESFMTSNRPNFNYLNQSIISRSISNFTNVDLIDNLNKEVDDFLIKNKIENLIMNEEYLVDLLKNLSKILILF